MDINGVEGNTSRRARIENTTVISTTPTTNTAPTTASDVIDLADESNDTDDLQNKQLNIFNNMSASVRILLIAVVVADGVYEPAYHTLHEINRHDAFYREVTSLPPRFDQIRHAVAELELAGLILGLNYKRGEIEVLSVVSYPSIFTNHTSLLLLMNLFSVCSRNLNP